MQHGNLILPIPPRIGPDEEAVILKYIANPVDHRIRDWILMLCERFIKTAWAKNKMRFDYEEFEQDAIVRCLELIDRFNPAQGRFDSWISAGMDGLVKSFRYKTNLREHRYSVSGLRVQTDTGTHGADSRSPRTRKLLRLDPALSSGDPATVFEENSRYTELRQLASSLPIRFIQPEHRWVCRGVLCYWLVRGRWPDEALVVRAYSHRVEDAMSRALYRHVRLLVQIELEKRWGLGAVWR